MLAVRRLFSRMAGSTLRMKYSTESSGDKFQCLTVQNVSEYVTRVELNRPEKRNALNHQLWMEIGRCFDELAEDSDCRAIVLSGAGKTFCAGLDFEDMGEFASLALNQDLDVSRKAWKLRGVIKRFQNAISAIEKCPKPVISAVHNGCLGGALALITAADIRYASQDAFFSIKEVDIGIIADVGTTQRIQKLVGNDSWTRELAFTCRNFHADEALRMGLVSRVFLTKEETVEAALKLAESIARKSPVAVQGTKVQLNYARDHTVDEALDYVASWNMGQLQSEDTMKAAMANAARDPNPPSFSKL